MNDRSGAENLKFKVPQYDSVDNALSRKGVEYFFGQETRQSKIGPLFKKTNVDRPSGLRVKRAEIYHQIHNSKNKNERSRLFKEAHEFDILNKQLMEKKIVSIEVEGCGVQEASYVALTANPKEKKQLPVFLWTGISNDPEGIGWLGIIIAKMTRRQVVIIGYPQGWDGNVTKEFGDAVKEKGMKPHTEFFVDSTIKIAKQMGIEKFKLIGMSTGAALAGNAVTQNHKFAEMLDSVGLVAPAGCVNINETIAKIREAIPMMLNATHLPYLSPINVHDVEMSAEKRANMLRAHEPLAKVMLSRTEWWKGIKQTKVKVTSIIFEGDYMTEGRKVTSELLGEEMDVKILKGSHITPMMHPEETVRLLFEME